MNPNSKDNDGPSEHQKSQRRGNHPRLRLVLFIAAVFFILAAAFYIRGTVASTVVKDPQTPADGVVTQLLVNESGEKYIRTAVVMPVQVATAWSILSDYDEWERLFKTVRSKKVAEPAGENQHHVVSDVMTPMGVISLDFIVTQDELPDGGYRAIWNAPTRELPVNKGTIEIHPLGADRTLLAYSIVKRYKIYPQFVVNNALYGHQTDIVKTLSARIAEVARK